MKRTLVLAASFVLAGCATTGRSVTPDPLVGEYDLTIDASGTTFAGVLVITSENGDYRGTLTSDMTEPTPVSGFTVTDETVAFEAAALGFTFLVVVDDRGLDGEFSGPVHGGLVSGIRRE